MFKELNNYDIMRADICTAELYIIVRRYGYGGNRNARTKIHTRKCYII